MEPLFTHIQYYELKRKKWIQFDNSIATYVLINNLMAIFADRNTRWDTNKIIRI